MVLQHPRPLFRPILVPDRISVHSKDS
jgi:hypothetical protein